MTPNPYTNGMADVKVRRVPDWVIEAFRSGATATGHSLEEELRLLLTQVGQQRRQEFLTDAEAFRQQLRTRYGRLSDSTAGIVEDREQRG